jgi:hypothetical protein
MPHVARIMPKLWRRRLRTIGRRMAHKSCVLLAIAGYGIACFGFPVVRHSEKDLSKPFPCADRPCGCMSADSCWDHCCCFSREQKLAWAVEHGVEVPAWVLARKVEPEKASQAVAKCSHCKPTPTKSCCAGRAKPAQTKWVLGMLARKCRGQGSDWLSSGAVLPAPLPIVWQPCIACVGNVFSFDALFVPPKLAPPLPPPRLAHSA